MGSYDSTLWFANAIISTGLLGIIAVWRWRAKGIATGVRWVGIALLPLALYFTRLLQLGWNIASDISSFISGFVFRPSVWLGLILGVIAAILIIVPGRIGRAFSDDDSPSTTKALPQKSSRRPAKAPVDDDMAEINEILKRHGID